MDEASILSAIQADLQNYKVKTQIRRKESQLHVLITRAEGDKIDYASLYDIVKSRIDKMAIEGASSFVLYGRLAGAKHPEWQKTGDIKPPLPLIEFDLEDLEDLSEIAELGSLNFPMESNETEIQTDSFDLNPDTFDSFKQSIENDLRRASLKTGDNNSSNHTGNHTSNHKNGNGKSENFDFGDLDLSGFEINNLQQKQNSFDLDSLDADHLEPDPFELSSPSSNHRSPTPIDKNAWNDDDLSLDQTTLAMPMPLPPPPLPPTRRNFKVDDNSEIQPDPKKSASPSKNSLLLSGAFAVVAIGILGICGWLLWDRSVQQKYIADARDLNSQNLNPKTVTKLESLAETRNQLQANISQLESIPDRPASLYTDAQTELTTLRAKLEDFDRKLNLEQGANKKLESARSGTVEAAKLVQNPPHKSTIWKSAQEKRQQAIQLLEEVPTDSLLYADAQKYLKTYRAELVQISKWVEIQQRAESVIANVSPNVVNQLKQLKTKTLDKQKFLPQCKAILQPQISSFDAQRVGLPVVTLTEYLCAYFWSS